MYYLYKQGVYGHGVFWIGRNLETGKRKADEAATKDCDGYHEWQLIKFKRTNLTKENVEWDSENEIVYIGKRLTGHTT